MLWSFQSSASGGAFIQGVVPVRDRKGSESPKVRKVERISAPVGVRVRVPGSRSITNRALVAAALAQGTSRLVGWLDADDTRAMRDCLGSLGATIEEVKGDLVVEGTGGKVRPPIRQLDCNQSGTTLRFMTAVSALADGWVALTGSPRLMERPLKPLLDTLEREGVRIATDDVKRTVSVCGPLLGGEVALDASTSGQFLSALLLAAPCAPEGMRIAVGPIASKPFVEMTRRVQEAFGARSIAMWSKAGGASRDSAAQIQEFPRRLTYIVRSTGYKATEYHVEPDVMSASYLFAAAAVTTGSVTVENLRRESMQGDVEVLSALEMMGCQVEDSEDGITVTGGPLKGVTFDVSEMPDMAPTLAVVACFASSKTTLTGTRHLKDKESDRSAGLSAELTKLGAKVLVGEDAITIDPPATVQAARIATYDDHRMAMAFSIAGLAADGIQIEDPDCVAKTFPTFFEVLEELSRV